jgi:competence protein ComEC
MLFPCAFFAGVMALLMLSAIPPLWAWIALALLGVAGTCLRRYRAAGAVLCGAALGWLHAGYHAADYLEDRWSANLAGERVIAQVIVDSIPAPRDGGWSFDAIARIERPDGHPYPLRVRLISRDASVQPHSGERWRLLLTLRPPTGRANPGSRDFERQLFRDGVHALGTVTASGVNRVIDVGHAPLTAVRERISRHIEAHVVDRDAAALISALAVGDTGRVSREQWRVFNATGTTHLVAISGLHVTLFAVVAFAVARWLWRFCFRIVCLQRDPFASICAFGAAACYATLAGLSVPTVRTLIMLGAWLLARSIARATRPFRPLGIALLAVLIFDPFAPLSAGFWLSFVAMGVIILVSSGRFIPRPLWREGLAVQAAISVALIPFTLALFGSVSLIGPAVNLLAIPAMSWVLVPAVLLSVVLMPLSTVASSGMLGLAEWLHNAGWPWLAATSDVPWALLHVSPPWWWYWLAVLSLGMALMPWPLLLRLSALICTVPLALSAGDTPRRGAVEITVLDVGEGTSVVAHTSHHALVFGTGDSYGSDGRVAETVVVPFLRSVGVGEINVLIPGASTVAASTGVTALLAQMPVRQTLVDCDSGRTAWTWDGVRFEVSANPSHACRVDIVTPHGRATIPGPNASIAAFVEATRERRWAVSSRRRAPGSANARALTGPAEGVQVITTAEHGAVRFQIDRETGVSAPSAFRANKRTLWSVSP